jgi:hypothetical protein
MADIMAELSHWHAWYKQFRPPEGRILPLQFASSGHERPTDMDAVSPSHWTDAPNASFAQATARFRTKVWVRCMSAHVRMATRILTGCTCSGDAVDMR